MKARVPTFFLAVSAVLLLSSCGTDDLGQQGFRINFSPRDLPAGTAYIRYYVLTVQTKAGGILDCDNFFVNDPRERVSDYPNDTVDFSTVDFSGSEGGAITIKDLNKGAYVFYVEALDDSRSILTCGCGEGQIEKGVKTTIPIRLIDDCL
jgi:hypothetical protein